MWKVPLWSPVSSQERKAKWKRQCCAINKALQSTKYVPHRDKKHTFLRHHNITGRVWYLAWCTLEYLFTWHRPIVLVAPTTFTPCFIPLQLTILLTIYVRCQTFTFPMLYSLICFWNKNLWWLWNADLIERILLIQKFVWRRYIEHHLVQDLSQKLVIGNIQKTGPDSPLHTLDDTDMEASFLPYFKIGRQWIL